MADHIGHLAHLNARNTTLVYASRAPQADIERVKARMGWEIPVVHHDRRLRRRLRRETNGTAPTRSIRDGDRVFRTYFINNRGDEVFVNTWSFLDMTALGRQETWEESPEGYPQTKPYEWWSWHDEYGEHGRPGDSVSRTPMTPTTSDRRASPKDDPRVGH